MSSLRRRDDDGADKWAIRRHVHGDLGGASRHSRASPRANQTGVVVMRLQRLAVPVALALVAGSFVLAGPSPAGATTTSRTVRASDVSLFPSPSTDWVSNDDNTFGPGDVSFVNGPATPPLGSGSARIGVGNTVSSASDLVYLNTANASTLFSQISALQ